MNYLLLTIAILPVICVAQNPFAGMKIFCQPEQVYIDIEEDGCRASNVAVQYCRGNCRSATMYHHEYPYFKSICECCKEKVSEKKLIELDCIKGDSVMKKMTWRDTVTACECSVCETKK